MQISEVALGNIGELLDYSPEDIEEGEEGEEGPVSIVEGGDSEDQARDEVVIGKRLLLLVVSSEY